MRFPCGPGIDPKMTSTAPCFQMTILVQLTGNETSPATLLFPTICSYIHLTPFLEDLDYILMTC